LESRDLPSTVTNLNDAGAGSLRQAILDTPTGGTVNFQPGLSGTITLTMGELLINKDLSIVGPGADVITVSGNNASRVFEIADTFTVDISALTIASGYVFNDDGGGILNRGTLTLTSAAVNGNLAAGFQANAGGIDNLNTLTVTGCVIDNNSASNAGGIDNDGTLTLTSSTLSGNRAASFDGGGIFNFGTLTVTNSTLSSNFGGNYGGGIFNYNASLTVTSSTLSSNSTSRSGGGIGNDSGRVTITSSTVSGNMARNDGGGIYAIASVSESTLIVSSSTLSGNSAGISGGGIQNGDDFTRGGSLTITSSTVSGNSAANAGGLSVGSAPGSDAVSITNSTVSGNSATRGSGGGLSDTNAPLTITNSTVSGNSASNAGGGILNLGSGTFSARNTLLAGNMAPGSPDLNGLLTSQGHNLIGNGSGGSGYDPTDRVGTASDPIDPKLGPLQDNGGPTQTMALLPGSPAIDAGDNTNAPMWDQRGPGFRRIVNGTIDIGAYEVQAHAHNPPTGQPLPDPLPVQVLATPAPPLLGQPPDLPAALSPLPEPGLLDGQAGQSEPVAVPTATGQQAPATSFGIYPGTGQPVASLGSWSANDLDLLALNMLGGP
jgi:hypothetical protein